MTTPKFTAGPWAIVYEYDGEGNERIDRIAAPCYEHENCEKTIMWRHVLALGRNTEANARLIAAAPDLYGALKDLLECGAVTIPCLEVGRAKAALQRADGDR